MSGPPLEAKTENPADVPAAATPDALEVAPGTAHEKLEGWIPQLAGEADVREALEKAFDYRGDITITLKNGSKVEGYVFDRRSVWRSGDGRDEGPAAVAVGVAEHLAEADPQARLGGVQGGLVRVRDHGSRRSRLT